MKTQCLSLQGADCAALPDGSAAPGAAVLLNLRRYWNNTYHAHLGASRWLDPDVELFGGIGFDTPAVPDATLEPTFMDADTVEASVGSRVFVARFVHVAVSFTLLQFFDRDNSGRSDLADAQLPTRQQDAGGHYDQRIGIVDVNFEKTF